MKQYIIFATAILFLTGCSTNETTAPGVVGIDEGATLLQQGGDADEVAVGAVEDVLEPPIGVAGFPRVPGDEHKGAAQHMIVLTGDHQGEIWYSLPDVEADELDDSDVIIIVYDAGRVEESTWGGIKDRFRNT
ncbi:MAG: membrane lipoprotein lipid attachment site-containing protein [Acidimicrobiia bacterium]|nr:membrane lipoprotein lipid attachment site-containing protein [Acidimicrobiia bacterium]